MKYRRLGKTGLRVSVIGVGTWQLGGEWGKVFEQSEVDAMLGAGRRAGHQSDRHRRMLRRPRGRAARRPGDPGPARELDRRDQVRPPVQRGLPAGQRVRAGAGRRSSWSSRSRPCRRTTSTSTSSTAARTRCSRRRDCGRSCGNWSTPGAIRHLGVSVSKKNASIYQVDQASAVGAEAIQTVYNRIERQAENEIAALVPEAEPGRPRESAAGQRIPERQVHQRVAVRPDGRPGRVAEATRRGVLSPSRPSRSEAEVPQGVPMAQWALAWCLRHPAVSCVIPGCKNVEQVESNAKAADLPDVSEDHPQAAR